MAAGDDYQGPRPTLLDLMVRGAAKAATTGKPHLFRHEGDYWCGSRCLPFALSIGSSRTDFVAARAEGGTAAAAYRRWRERYEQQRRQDALRIKQLIPGYEWRS